MNKWEKHLGIDYPDCNSCGSCCKMASPSSPYMRLIDKAAKGDQNARDFLNLFIPYTFEEQSEFVPESHVERCRTMALKSNKFSAEDQVVFYYCRFIGENNKCLIYEDRPQLCRTYPDTPFLVMPPGCVYQEWSKTCKKQYFEMNKDLKLLKFTQNLLKETDKIIFNRASYNILDSLVSPGKSWMR